MIGKTIKKIRLEKGLSLSELARLSNIPVTSLHNIENGVSKNPGWYHICAIADALNISIEEIRRLEIQEGRQTQ